MKIRFRHSIRWRYAFVFASVTAVIIIVSWLFFSVFLQPFYYEHQKKSMRDVRARLEESWRDETMSTEQLARMMGTMAEQYHVSFLILDSDGSSIYSSYSDVSQLSRLKEHMETILYERYDDHNVQIIENADNYFMWEMRDQETGTVYLESMGLLPMEESFRLYIVSFPLAAISESVKLAKEFLLYVGLAAILISAVIAFFVTGRIAKPIVQLTEISQRMGGLDFNARYTGKEKNEIGVLGNNINLLSERLENTISELKTANLELQQDIEQKTEIDLRRREFLADVSHELKTPIALIRGYAEGLQELQGDPESTDYYCSVIIDEANKMNSLVKRLTALNQLEAHGEKIEMERFCSTELIYSVLRSSELLIRQKEAQIQFLHSGSNYVWGDAFQIEEVVTNYLSNALNHLEGDHRIQIKEEEVPEKNQIRISVFNEGEPIPSEDISKIWEKFYKVDKARTREYGGSGIGLSIVKAIMEGHHQEYGVENQEGGVMFWFTLEKG